VWWDINLHIGILQENALIKHAHHTFPSREHYALAYSKIIFGPDYIEQEYPQLWQSSQVQLTSNGQNITLQLFTKC
jgi:hypothetical protein